MNPRYSRQIIVEGIGLQGQEKLKNGNILVIGCGALGSMCAMQLAGAGVGTIGIADFDTIDETNLHRQLFYNMEERGKKKTEILKEKINALNPEIEVITHNVFIRKENAVEIFKDYDFVIDATDNSCSKRMIGELCRETKKAYCTGGIAEFRGQVTTIFPGNNLMSDYFEEEEDGMLPCEIKGVVSPAAGVCASIQSGEALKYLLGIGDMLKGKMLFFDLLKGFWKVVNL